MKVLFINFADTGYHLGNKSSQSLKKKYSNSNDEVKLIELGTSAFKVLATHETSFADDQQITEALENIKQFKPDHIIIGVHGNIDNTTHCFHHNYEYGSQKLADVQAFATFIYQLTNEITPNLTLAMCYGARTDQYLQDHAQNNISFETSFAYNFIKHLRNLSKNKTIHLDACTGAISFSNQTGNMQVETRIMLNQEKKPYIIYFGENIEKLNQLQSQLLLDSKEKFMQYIEKKQYLTDTSELGKRLRLDEAKFDFLENVETMEYSLNVPKESEKCGIISFKSDDTGLSYARKYSDEKVQKTTVSQYAQQLKTIVKAIPDFQLSEPPPYTCQIM